MASFPAQVDAANMDIPVKIMALKREERKIAENCTLLVVVSLLCV